MMNTRPHFAMVLAIVVLPALSCGCNANSSDDGFKTVQSSYNYGGNNKRTREWRALMTALDKCHQGGFNNAVPAGPPQVTCVQGAPSECMSYRAIQSYDCVGMGN